jgi:mRNA-degrading endonuclease RelE of RelBE toxin-antitoxin system
MFNIAWTASALHDLRFFEKREQRIIADGIDEQLLHEPLTKTRNRKPLRPNSLAKWEVRLGDFRVLYDASEETGVVEIKGVGWKVHNKLYFRGEERSL